MRRMFSIFRSPVALAGLVLAAFVLTGLAATFALGGFGLAQEETPTVPTAEETATAPEATPAEKDALRDQFLDNLAEQLGISRERLDQALSQAALDVVDQAVADGRITQEEADRIQEAIESGEFPFFFGRHGFGHGFGHHGFGPGLGCPGVAADELAGFLGISVDDLRAARAEGQSLAQIAEANSKTRDELKSYLLSRVGERLDQAVADGKITQEQADQKLEDFSARLDDLIDSTGGPGFGGPWWPHGPKEESDDTASETTL